MTTPCRYTIPREAPGCTCSPTSPASTPAASRAQIQWARVGGALFLGGGLGLAADLFSMVVLTLESGHAVPDAARWIAAACSAVMALGLTAAATAEGKAFPHLL